MRQSIRFFHMFMLFSLQAVSLSSLVLGQAQKADVEVQIHLTRAGAPKEGRTFAPPVVLWLSPVSAEAQTSPASASIPRYRMTQKNKHFDPTLLVVPLGSTVEFPNLDPFFHNVFSQFNGKRFDLGLYEAGSTKGVRFNHEGISYIFCNIHPEMAAVIVTLSTPYFSVSSGSGSAVIHQVPVGNYVMHVWAEGADAKNLEAVARRVYIDSTHDDLGVIEIVASGTLAPHKNKFDEDYRPEETPTY